jgi:hypothetical protein
LVLGVVAVGLLILAGRRWAGGASRSTDGVAVEREWRPLARKVEVEVLNAGGGAGAARDAALRLRRGRLDVVYWGNASEGDRDSMPRRPRIMVRRGDTAGVGRVREVLGDAEVVDAPDTVPLVDLTVIVWRSDSD